MLRCSEIPAIDDAGRGVKKNLDNSKLIASHLPVNRRYNRAMVLRRLARFLGVSLVIVCIGYLDSLSRDVSQSLLYGVLCIWAGYRLRIREAALTVVGCVAAHIITNRAYFPELSDHFYLQSAGEAVLLAIVAWGARAQLLGRQALEVSREQADHAHQVLKQHLELASQVQCELLGTPPTSLEPYDLGLEFAVAVELGGDVFYVCRVPDGIFFFVGDVSGKGPKAALASTCTRVLLESIVRETHSPGQVLAELQRRFIPLFPGGLFITAFCAFAHPAEECLIYSNAGHDSPLLCRPDHPGLEELVGQAMPVGVDSEEVFPDSRLPFGPGDRLLVYTDGLIDARKAGGGRLGVDPVAQRLFHFKGPSQQLAKSLVGLAPEPRHDDVMVLVLRFQSKPAAVSPQTIGGRTDSKRPLSLLKASSLSSRL